MAALHSGIPLAGLRAMNGSSAGRYTWRERPNAGDRKVRERELHRDLMGLRSAQRYAEHGATGPVADR